MLRPPGENTRKPRPADRRLVEGVEGLAVLGLHGGRGRYRTCDLSDVHCFRFLHSRDHAFAERMEMAEPVGFGCPTRHNALANPFATGWRPGLRASTDAGPGARPPARIRHHLPIRGCPAAGTSLIPAAAPRPRFHYTEVGVDKGGRMR